jgi:hypothetical protein
MKRLLKFPLKKTRFQWTSESTRWTNHLYMNRKINQMTWTSMMIMGTDLLFELGEDLRVAHVLHRKSGQRVLTVFIRQLGITQLLVVVWLKEVQSVLVLTNRRVLITIDNLRQMFLCFRAPKHESVIWRWSKIQTKINLSTELTL